MQLEGGKITHVICPYCCHRFAPDEADFRLPSALPEASPEPTTADPADAAGEPTPKKRGRKKATLGKIRDEKLYAYLTKLLCLSEKEAEQRAMQFEAVSAADPRVSADASERRAHGFVSKITFTEGGQSYESEERLCPNCHNTLPVGYGLRQTVLISIIGDARAGKSVYLTMLIHELENNRDFPSKLSYIGDAATRELIFDNYQKPLLQDRVLIDSTKRKRIPPFSYNFWYQYRGADGSLMENTIDIIFYDIAGEDMRDDYSIRQNGFNIRDSSGLIFLLDPTNFRSLRDVFMLRDRDIVDAIPEANSIQRVFSAMFNYFIGMDTEKCGIPLALTVSKVDLFRFAELPYFANRPNSRLQAELDGEGYKGFIDMRTNRSIHLEVRELLSYLNEDSALHNAYGCFKHICCFAVSSLGRKPITEKISDPETNETVERGVIDGEPTPFRVKDPFYWILFKNNLLYYSDGEGFYRNAERPEPGNTAASSPVGRVWAALRRLAGLFRG